MKRRSWELSSEVPLNLIRVGTAAGIYDDAFPHAGTTVGAGQLVPCWPAAAMDEITPVDDPTKRARIEILRPKPGGHWRSSRRVGRQLHGQDPAVVK